MFRTLSRFRLNRDRNRARRTVQSAALRDVLEAPLPDLSAAWTLCEFLVVDLETTGLDAQQDHLISIGWLPVRQGRVQLGEARRQIVFSPQPMNQTAAIHGLRDAEVREGMELDAALTAFLAALGSKVLVVHYRGLDKTLLDRLCLEQFGARLAVPCVDTLPLAVRALRMTEPAQDALRLTTLRTRLGLPGVSQHDALTDAYATAELFLVLAQRMGSRSRPASTGQLLA